MNSMTNHRTSVSFMGLKFVAMTMSYLLLQLKHLGQYQRIKKLLNINLIDD